DLQRVGNKDFKIRDGKIVPKNLLNKSHQMAINLDYAYHSGISGNGNKISASLIFTNSRIRTNRNPIEVDHFDARVKNRRINTKNSKKSNLNTENSVQEVQYLYLDNNKVTKISNNQQNVNLIKIPLELTRPNDDNIPSQYVNRLEGGNASLKGTSAYYDGAP